MAWLRLDEHIPENTKVQLLAPMLFKFWINALCVAKKTDGKFTDMEATAYRLHLPRTRLVISLEQLRTAGLVNLVNGVYCIHDWEKWQYKDSSTPRMRRLRKDRNSDSPNRHCDGDTTVTCDESPPVTNGANVTKSPSVYSASLEVKSQEQETASRDPVAFDFDATGWASKLCSEWRKPGNKGLGRRYLLEALSEGAIPLAVTEGFSRWVIYWDSIGWQYCNQDIAGWAYDKMWDEQPPEIRHNGKADKESETTRILRERQERRAKNGAHDAENVCG